MLAATPTDQGMASCCSNQGALTVLDTCWTPARPGPCVVPAGAPNKIEIPWVAEWTYSLSLSLSRADPLYNRFEWQNLRMEVPPMPTKIQSQAGHFPALPGPRDVRGRRHNPKEVP